MCISKERNKMLCLVVVFTFVFTNILNASEPIATLRTPLLFEADRNNKYKDIRKVALNGKDIGLDTKDIIKKLRRTNRLIKNNKKAMKIYLRLSTKVPSLVIIFHGKVNLLPTMTTPVIAAECYRFMGRYLTKEENFLLRYVLYIYNAGYVFDKDSFHSNCNERRSYHRSNIKTLCRDRLNLLKQLSSQFLYRLRRTIQGRTSLFVSL